MGPGGRLSAKKGDMAAKLGLWLREGGQASRAPPVPPRRLPVLSPLCWARPPEALPFRGRPGTKSPLYYGRGDSDSAHGWRGDS